MKMLNYSLSMILIIFIMSFGFSFAMSDYLVDYPTVS